MGEIELTVGGQQVIDLLTRLLDETKQGRIQGLAVIVPRVGQVDPIIVGSAPASDLYFGAAALQHKIMNHVSPPEGRASPILYAPGR